MPGFYYLEQRRKGRRAKSKARRLSILMYRFLSDPAEQFQLRGEAVNLARGIVAYVGRAELLVRLKSSRQGQL